MDIVKRKFIWIIIAIIIKFSFSTIIVNNLSLHHLTDGFYGRFTGDSSGYTLPIENFIKHGHYAINLSDVKTYARRMPGYGIFFFFPRLFFTQSNAFNILVILQILISAISVYYLALTAYLIFPQISIFYITFFLYVFSTYVSIFDSMIATESFSAAGLIFTFYFLVKALINRDDKKSVFFSGFFLSWCIFLKPYFILFLPIFSIFFLLKHFIKKTIPLKFIVINFVIFISSFCILESAWVWRNYKIYNHFVPLVYTGHLIKGSVGNKLLSLDGGMLSSSSQSLYNFVQAIGGRIVSWDPKSEVCWVEGFGAHNTAYWKPSYDAPQNNPFPNFIYTSKYNFSSLVAMRKVYLMAHDISLAPSEREKHEKNITSILKEYTDSFIKEHPFHYYITARLRAISIFLFHSGTYNLFLVTFNDMNLMQKVFKIIFSLLYLSIIIGGLFGIILVLLKKLNFLTVFLCIMSFYFIVLFAIVWRNPNYRFFVPGYPFMAILTSYITVEVINFFEIFRKNNSIKTGSKE